MILSNTQAQTIYAAMCELNNIGARLLAQIPVKGNCPIEVDQMRDGKITVLDYYNPGEEYLSQEMFAAAYGLELR